MCVGIQPQMQSLTSRICLLGILVLDAWTANAAEIKDRGGWYPDTIQSFMGIKIKAGGRYDDVRMCVASKRGAKGGPALDITFYVEWYVNEHMNIGIDIPLFRPALFGAAFKMLQFEPEVSVLFKVSRGEDRTAFVGPTVGLSFHYGPDYRSGLRGDERSPSFFAMGPRLGAIAGVNFKRPTKEFNPQLALNPYITPMFAGYGDKLYQGIVVGGSIDTAIRFHGITVGPD